MIQGVKKSLPKNLGFINFLLQEVNKGSFAVFWIQNHHPMPEV